MYEYCLSSLICLGLFSTLSAGDQMVYFRCNSIWQISFRQLRIGQELELACFAQIKVQVSDSEQRSHVFKSYPPPDLIASLSIPDH